MRELNAKIEEQSDRERIAPIRVSYWTDWERKVQGLILALLPLVT